MLEQSGICHHDSAPSAPSASSAMLWRLEQGKAAVTGALKLMTVDVCMKKPTRIMVSRIQLVLTTIIEGSRRNQNPDEYVPQHEMLYGVHVMLLCSHSNTIIFTYPEHPAQNLFQRPKHGDIQRPSTFLEDKNHPTSQHLSQKESKAQNTSARIHVPSG